MGLGQSQSWGSAEPSPMGPLFHAKFFVHKCGVLQLTSRGSARYGHGRSVQAPFFLQFFYKR